MLRTLRIGAGLGLALFIVTCTDRSPSGPGRHGASLLDFSALTQFAPGEPAIPMDSVRIVVRGSADQALLLDVTFALGALDSSGAADTLSIDVPLRTDPEAVTITITATGAGVTWYTGTAAATLTNNQTTAPGPLTLTYVGPGAGADSVRIQTVSTRIVGGTGRTMTAAVWGPGGLLTGVPVGYRTGSSAVATTASLTLNTATVTGAVPVRDSTWVYAETPTHLRDSIRVQVVPPATTLVTISGSGQTGPIGVPLPAPLVVQVRDMLNGGFLGQTVTWTVTAGLATLSAPTSLSDDTGYAAVTVTPTGSAPLTIQASAAGLTGSPLSFIATVAGAGGLASVTLNRVTDTIPKNATLQYTATLRDSSNNVIAGTVTWSTTAGGIASVTTNGLATALAGGNSRIIAAAGGFADTAFLWVRALTTMAVTPADTVITAVGDSVLLAAAALDNFGDTVSTGVVLRYVSATPTVATVNAVTGRVHLVGPGNAVVLARDTVSGTQGPATLRVNQTPDSVGNTQDSLQVGVLGRGQIVARAFDRNGHPIPGRPLAWVSRATSVATVDQTGMVTGVALGTTYIVDSLVDSAGVFLDSTRIDVVPSPPTLIQWAFDSTAVGNGGNFSVALSLSRPDPSPLVVKFTSSDTNRVRTSTRTITIPANQPGTSVTIQGLAFTPSPVMLIAEDSSGLGYLPDTMLVNVVSTIEFREIGSFTRQSNFYVNRNETHQAQVFLSDPAPAGGLGVTFVYGQPGKSAVTPSPAIIPAGQLAANVVIQGVGVGQDSVVPTSGGFVGRHSYVAVAPESLHIQHAYPYNGVLGVGQTLQPYLSYTYAMDHPLTVALNLSPAIGTVPSTVTVQSGTYYAYFPVEATAPGSATLTITAPGWIGTSLPFVFSTPHLVASGTASMIAGDPARGSWYVSTADSLRYGHQVIDSVPVTAVSRNGSAVVVDVGAGQVVPGTGSVNVGNALRALPTAGGDSSWIVLTSPGYQSDSFQVHVTAPTLTFSYGYPYDGRVGIGTLFQNAGYVQIPYVRPDTFWVVFSHTARAVIGGPDSVAILPGQTYTYFDVQGDSLGVDTLTITRATGYAFSGGQFVYRTGPLRVRPYSYPTTLYTISAPQQVNAIVVDSANGTARPLLAPLTVALTARNPAAVTLDSPTVRIPAGAYFSNYDTLRRVGVDTAGSYLVASAPGTTTDSAGPVRVYPTPLTIGFGYPYSVGRGLKLRNNYVTITGGNAPDTVRIALQNLLPAIDSLTPDTVRILPGQNFSQYFTIFGLDTTATDTIVATATNYVTDTATIRPQSARLDVSDPGTSHLTTDPSFRVRTYSETRNGYVLDPIAPVPYTFVSVNPIIMRIDSVGGGSGSVNGTRDTATAVIDTALGYSDVWISFVGSGTSKLHVFAPGFDPDSTAPTTVTGPSLNLAYATITVGQSQLFTSQYVTVSNAVPAPLVVHLARSDSTLPLASQAFTLSADSVVINTGQTSSPFFDIVGNAIGTAQLIARAAGYTQDVSTISVGVPQLSVQANLNLYVGQRPPNVTVSTQDQSGSGRVVAAPTVIARTSSNPTVASSDSATRTIATRAGSTTFPIRALQKGGVDLVFSTAGYKPDTLVVTVDTAKLALTGAPNGLGAGQVAQTTMYVDIPYTTDSALVVTLQNSAPGVLTVPPTVTIPAGASLAYFDVTGVATGIASIIATAPHSFPDTQPVVIGTPRLVVSLTANTNAGQAYTISVSARDSLNVTRNVTAPLTVTLASSVPGHTAFTANPLTIAAGSSSANTTIVFDTAGSYTVTANASGYNAGNATSTTTGAQVLIVDTPSQQFSPATITIPVGQRVTWRNAGLVTHNTTEDATGLWNSNVAVGNTFQRLFSAAGTFLYHCAIHPGMTGTVIVN